MRGSNAAKASIELADEPKRFLSTLHIGITLIGILTGIYSGDALADDSIDNMLGMVYLKDLAIILYKKYFCLGHILRPATYYPKNTSMYTTMSGFILNKLERIPQSGEYIEWEGFRLEIVDMDGIRIDKVLVTKME